MMQPQRLARLICLFLLAVVMFELSAKAQTGIDRVTRRNGTDSGQITKVTPLGVTISKGGVTSHIPAEEIRSISFDGEPPQFNTIRRAIDQGRFDSAQETLQKIESSDLSRPEVRQEFDYFKSICQGNLALAGKGDLQEALASVNEFLVSNRTSYHVPEAIELQGDLNLAIGNVEEAQKKYETLAKAPAAYYKARSALLLGKLFQREGDPIRAIEQFDQVLDIARGVAVAEEMLLTAELQRAVSFSASDKSDEGIDIVKRLIISAPSDNAQQLAQGYNALGNCYIAADDPQAARDAFLHVHLLFSTASDEHAEALYHLAGLWKQLNQPTRAQEAEQALAKEYPLSRWAGR